MTRFKQRGGKFAPKPNHLDNQGCKLHTMYYYRTDSHQSTISNSEKGDANDVCLKNIPKSKINDTNASSAVIGLTTSTIKDPTPNNSNGLKYNNGSRYNYNSKKNVVDFIRSSSNLNDSQHKNGHPRYNLHGKFYNSDPKSFNTRQKTNNGYGARLNSENDLASNSSRGSKYINNKPKSKTYNDSKRNFTSGTKYDGRLTKSFDASNESRRNFDSGAGEQLTTDYQKNSSFKLTERRCNTYKGKKSLTETKFSRTPKKQSIWNEEYLDIEEFFAPNEPTIWTSTPSYITFQTKEEKRDEQESTTGSTSGTLSTEKAEYGAMRSTSTVYSIKNFQPIDDVNPGDQFQPCEPKKIRNKRLV